MSRYTPGRWTPISTEIFSDPKILATGPRRANATLIYIAALCYCQRHHTDGTITRTALIGAGTDAGLGRRATISAIEALTEVGLLITTDSALDARSRGQMHSERAAIAQQTRNTFVIPAWSKWNRTADQIAQEQAAARERMRRSRARKGEGRYGERSPERSPNRYAEQEANVRAQRREQNSPLPPPTNDTPPPTPEEEELLEDIAHHIATRAWANHPNPDHVTNPTAWITTTTRTTLTRYHDDALHLIRTTTTTDPATLADRLTNPAHRPTPTTDPTHNLPTPGITDDTRLTLADLRHTLTKEVTP